MNHQPAVGFIAVDAQDVDAQDVDAQDVDAQDVDAQDVDASRHDRSAMKAELSRALVAAFGRFKQEMGPRLAALGLSPVQARSLRHLGDPLTMRELADAIGTEPSNLTPVVDRLESAGLLQRRPRPGDRRIRELCLTVEGNRIRERLDNEVFDNMAIFDRLTRAQQTQLLRLLERLAARGAPSRR